MWWVEGLCTRANHASSVPCTGPLSKLNHHSNGGPFLKGTQHNNGPTQMKIELLIGKREYFGKVHYHWELWLNQNYEIAHGDTGSRQDARKAGKEAWRIFQGNVIAAQPEELNDD